MSSPLVTPIPEGPSILWFRHGLRIHDNPAFHEALLNSTGVIPLFIFDGESAGTAVCGYNRMSFLLECLQSLDDQFRKVGAQLYIFKGRPTEIFAKLIDEFGVKKICFEQDCEPVWQKRDEEIQRFCQKRGVQWIEKIGHTLWNPHEIIRLNGGTPPLTFSTFNYVTSCLGQPDKPLPDVDLQKTKFVSIPRDFGHFESVPKPEDVGVEKEEKIERQYKGGEQHGLLHLEMRLQHELDAFKRNKFMPNRMEPDILCPPMSLSPHLRFGCISVRRFYWGIIDTFREHQESLTTKKKPFNPMIVSQLLWREFFYTMSVNNPYYGEMERNEICINIPWYDHENSAEFQAFAEGKTGYPFIDAGMRQMYKEGWIHHIVRNAIACFLTRGDMWMSWEPGLQIFLRHLIDADWSVCAGNWMWVSSSAFEQVLNCEHCINPGTYGRRFDPWGEYVKRFVPELAKYPVEYIYEPWKAPKAVQEKAGCVVGKDYPERIVVHEEVAPRNIRHMKALQEELLKKCSNEIPRHCAPSSAEETRTFMKFEDSCSQHQHQHGCCNR